MIAQSVETVKLSPYEYSGMLSVKHNSCTYPYKLKFKTPANYLSVELDKREYMNNIHTISPSVALNMVLPPSGAQLAISVKTADSREVLSGQLDAITENKIVIDLPWSKVHPGKYTIEITLLNPLPDIQKHVFAKTEFIIIEDPFDSF